MHNIQENISLSKYTTFRIGGPAWFFVEVENEEELKEALNYAKDNNLEFFILGGGSNILVSDSGFDGLIIKLQNTKHNIRGVDIEVGAGASLAKIIKVAIENGLVGMEWAAGIPGTIGGAVRGNAGAFGGDMKSLIGSVRVLDVAEMKIKNYELSKCKFNYRDSIFKHDKNLVVLSVILRLKSGDKNESQEKAREIIRQRISKQPEGLACAGSFFVNPVVKNADLIREFEEESGAKSRENKIPAGWLIEKAGLQKKKIGGAMVSEKHANFIVNTGNATAEDVIMLASLIKQQVRDKFGVELAEEVQYIGF